MEETCLQRIKRLLGGLPPLPWSVDSVEVNGVDAPGDVRAAAGPVIISHEYGLAYGINKDSEERRWAIAGFFVESRINTEILLSALEKACGYNEDLMNQLLEHAQKEQLNKCGLVPDDFMVKRRKV